VSPSAAAVFFDKDGTLVENVPYNVDPAKVRLAPRAAECVAALRDKGYRVVLVSNQPGLAMGLFTERALQAVRKEIEGQLCGELDGFYYCAHRADAGCRCRKPSPGLLLQAARELRLRLSGSWMIGDILDDVEAGRRAGCRAILVDNGNETEWKRGPAREPHFVVRDLGEAAQRILACKDECGPANRGTVAA
jgi:D-glycero-D-manno-heptose 1,7-bisphosphate phosphatase